MLTGLTPFTSYSVQVAAVNDGGIGPYSNPLTVKTLHNSKLINVNIMAIIKLAACNVCMHNLNAAITQSQVQLLVCQLPQNCYNLSSHGIFP